MCLNTIDKFTIDSKNGNDALKFPVGLITADEVVFAGFNTNYSNSGNYQDNNNYLCLNSYYRALSPMAMSDFGHATIGYVHNNGYIYYTGANANDGVRPVISLKSGTTATGSGTATDPYVVN